MKYFMVFVFIDYPMYIFCVFYITFSAIYTVISEQRPKFYEDIAIKLIQCN